MILNPKEDNFKLFLFEVTNIVKQLKKKNKKFLDNDEKNDKLSVSSSSISSIKKKKKLKGSPSPKKKKKNSIGFSKFKREITINSKKNINSPSASEQNISESNVKSLNSEKQIDFVKNINLKSETQIELFKNRIMKSENCIELPSKFKINSEKEIEFPKKILFNDKKPTINDQNNKKKNFENIALKKIDIVSKKKLSFKFSKENFLNSN